MDTISFQGWQEDKLSPRLKNLCCLKGSLFSKARDVWKILVIFSGHCQKFFLRSLKGLNCKLQFHWDHLLWPKLAVHMASTKYRGNVDMNSVNGCKSMSYIYILFSFLILLFLLLHNPKIKMSLSFSIYFVMFLVLKITKKKQLN